MEGSVWGTAVATRKRERGGGIRVYLYGSVRLVGGTRPRSTFVFPRLFLLFSRAVSLSQRTAFAEATSITLPMVLLAAFSLYIILISGPLLSRTYSSPTLVRPSS